MKNIIFYLKSKNMVIESLIKYYKLDFQDIIFTNSWASKLARFIKEIEYFEKEALQLKNTYILLDDSDTFPTRNFLIKLTLGGKESYILEFIVLNCDNTDDIKYVDKLDIPKNIDKSYLEGMIVTHFTEFIAKMRKRYVFINFYIPLISGIINNITTSFNYQQPNKFGYYVVDIINNGINSQCILCLNKNKDLLILRDNMSLTEEHVFTTLASFEPDYYIRGINYWIWDYIDRHC